MGPNEIRALWRLLRDRRARLLCGIVVLGVQALALLPITFLVHDIFAVQIPVSNSTAVVVNGIGILVLYAASAALSLGSRRLILVSLFDSIAVLRMQVFGRLHDLPLSWHEKQDIGRLHARLVLDGERLEACLPSLVPVLQAIVVGIPLTVVAVIVSPLLAGVLLVVAPAMMWLNTGLKGRTERAIKTWSITHRAFGAHVLRTLRSMKLIRTLGIDDAELDEAGERVSALAVTSLGKSWSSNLATVANGAIAGVAGCVILVVGGYSVSKDWLTLSELLTFYAVVALALRNVTGAAGAGANLMVATASLVPLQEIIDDPCPSVYDGSARTEFDGTITLRGVTFGYGHTAVLHQLDLEIASGERLALIGANGSGKSTVARLVLGLDRPWAGTVSASGCPLEHLDVAWLRRQIGVVLQESSLCPGTIRQNIVLRRPESTPGQLAATLRASGITEILDSRFADGIDTEVGDDGVRLSGGERQAVSIARALIGTPRLLILDEPGNHLDGAAVHRLQSAIEAMKPPPAVLLITHDPKLAAWADRVVRLEDGRAHPHSAIARPA